MFNHVAHYRYLLPTLYLSVADILNPDLFVSGSRTWISLDVAFFRRIANHPAGPHCWGRERSTQFAKGLPYRCDSSTRVSFVDVIMSHLLHHVFLVKTQYCFDNIVHHFQLNNLCVLSTVYIRFNYNVLCFSTLT